jgi:hypothetical protein
VWAAELANLVSDVRGRGDAVGAAVFVAEPGHLDCDAGLDARVALGDPLGGDVGVGELVEQCLRDRGPLGLALDRFGGDVHVGLGKRICDRVSVYPDLRDLVGARGCSGDRLLGLRVLGGQRDLFDLLAGGHPRAERAQRRRPLQRHRVIGYGLAEVRGRVVDHELEPDPLGQAPDEVPVSLVVLLHEVVRVPAGVAVRGKPRLLDDLLDDVAGGLVLERPRHPGADQSVRAVVASRQQLDAAGAEV